MKNKKTYFDRQLYFLSNIGLFYIIILSLFAIPLLGAFVVILIKGLLDLKEFIIYGGSIFVAFILILFIGWLYKLKKNSQAFLNEADKHLQSTSPVQISILKGLITFTYGRAKEPSPMLENTLNRQPLIPHTDNSNKSDLLIDQIRQLTDLKNQGNLTETEFQTLKNKILQT